MTNKDTRQLLASMIEGTVTEVTDDQFLSASTLASEAADFGSIAWNVVVSHAVHSQLRMQRIADLIAASDNPASKYAGARKAAAAAIGSGKGWTIRKSGATFVPTEYDGALKAAKDAEKAEKKLERERLQAESLRIAQAAQERLDAALDAALQLLGYDMPDDASRAEKAETILAALQAASQATESAEEATESAEEATESAEEAFAADLLTRDINEELFTA